MASLVVKDNVLINASYNLDLVEQRLILLAIVEARQSSTGITAKDPLAIHAESYIQQFNVHRNTAYQALKDACASLFARQFTYQEKTAKGNLMVKTSRWVSEIGYADNEAMVSLIFSPAIVPFITQLEKHFTSYELEQVSGLKSAYAVRLYELLIAWRSSGKVPVIDLNDFRHKLGVIESEYKLIADLKKRVLDVAIKQINENTDITASYEQHKAGRVINGFSFTFKFKKSAKTTKKTTLESTPTPAPDPDAEKREAYAQFLNYQRQAKLLKETIEQLATKKELKQFKAFGFMK